MIITADITCKELQAARVAAELYQYQVAHLMHVSEDIISRWERGETLPTPDQVAELETLYKAPGLWWGWMRYHYKSFRDRFGEQPEDTMLALTMVQAGYVVEDLAKIQDATIRDAADGRIDDKNRYAAYMEKVRQVHALLGHLLEKDGMKVV